ncbi:hypothetical protein NB311A_20831 [Nitrobacter sp. Nb-311A]|nr:hypothetical protein NB311A_20831 [Nitrobacter sp. Nb-311A]
MQVCAVQLRIWSEQPRSSHEPEVHLWKIRKVQSKALAELAKAPEGDQAKAIRRLRALIATNDMRSQCGSERTSF